MTIYGKPLVDIPKVARQLETRSIRNRPSIVLLSSLNQFQGVRYSIIGVSLWTLDLRSVTKGAQLKCWKHDITQQKPICNRTQQTTAFFGLFMCWKIVWQIDLISFWSRLPQKKISLYDHDHIEFIGTVLLNGLWQHPLWLRYVISVLLFIIRCVSIEGRRSPITGGPLDQLLCV